MYTFVDHHDEPNRTIRFAVVFVSFPYVFKQKKRDQKKRLAEVVGG